MIGFVGDSGILEEGSEPPCPVCGKWGGLGYYGDWMCEPEAVITCDNCGAEIQIERIVEYHYIVKKISSEPPCIFPAECRNLDIHNQRPCCLGSKEYRERYRCASHTIPWYPDGLPEDTDGGIP